VLTQRCEKRRQSGVEYAHNGLMAIMETRVRIAMNSELILSIR